jgi:hypothetical protein
MRLFSHELLQSFSFHLFAKRPIEPITTPAALRRDIMRRMTLSALQIRLNVQQRQDPLFTFVDFNQLNWPREGCAVCSLDMTTGRAYVHRFHRVLSELSRLLALVMSTLKSILYSYIIFAFLLLTRYRHGQLARGGDPGG